MNRVRKNLDYIYIVFGVVLVWRGIWGLLDEYLFPNHDELSYAVSVALGLVLLFLHDHKKHDVEELLK